MATMNMQMVAVDYIMCSAFKHFEIAFDVMVNFYYADTGKLCAAWIALVIYFMGQMWTLMTVEAMSYMLSHVGRTTK